MSSYQINHYDLIICDLVQLYRPKTIIEFGVLEGYSLGAILGAAPVSAKVIAYDIFEEFPGHHANKTEMERRFSGIIQYGDFYKVHEKLEDSSIDMFHIDIANTGDTYEFFLQNYLRKLSSGGIALLEGGSSERDDYEWMKKYNKPKIRPVVTRLMKAGFECFTFEPFPSMTIIKG